MSLKAFHIFFVVVSALMCVGVGVWSFRNSLQTGRLGPLAFGAGSLAASVVLIWYGVWFLRKLKGVSFL